MSVCPFCGDDIIEGIDECEQCGQTLTEFSLPVPATRVEKDLMKDTIATLSPRTPLTMPPETPVGKALDQMVSQGIGCVIVVNDDQVVGIFSERDAVSKLNVDASRLANQPISQFMTISPITLSSDVKIAFALHKMNLGGYRHLPILKAGKLTGVISIRDILAYLTKRIVPA